MTALEAVGADFIQGYGKDTRARYRIELRQFIGWCEGRGLTLHTVRRVHLELYRQYLIEDRRLAQNTVSTYMGTVGMLFRYATEEDWIDRDPAKNVHRGRKLRQSTSQWLNRDQLRILLAVSSREAHPDLNAAIHILALNGLRIGEMLNLRRDEVQHMGGMLCVKIRGRKYSPGGQYVSLARPTLAALQPLLDARSTGWLIRVPKRHMGPAARLEERVRRHGARIRLALHQLCEQNGLPQITPHGLRHTFITLARDAGVSDRDLMAATGHIDPRMLAYYDRARASIDRNATHKLVTYLES